MGRLAVSARRARAVAVASGTAAIVTAANASQGAYFSQSWGWVALAFLMPTTVLIVLDLVVAPGRLRSAFAVLVVLMGAWIALSALWSSGVSAPLREGERMLAYVALALFVALALRRGDGPSLLAGVALGVTVVCAYALGTRLAPDVLETFDSPGLPYRLSQPVGYWNSLGLLAAMGLIACFGVVAHARRTFAAIAAAGAMPILALTLYFTFSRGAWAAQVLGFAVMVAFDPRRLRLLCISTAVSLPSLAAVLVASQQTSLTTEGADPALVAAEGHRLALALAPFVLCSIAVSLGARWATRRVHVSARTVRAFDVTLVVAVACVSIAGLVVAGGPRHGFEALKARFEAPGVFDQSNLNARLLSISGSGRSGQIEVAIDEGREQPLIGQGAGSYEAAWYRNRVSAYAIRDAHSLYAEMFGEVGLVGLTLLLAALATPLFAGYAARRSWFVPGATGAYAAWLAHSSLDWNWELVGVTASALLAGAVALVTVERPRAHAIRGGTRIAMLGLLLPLTMLSVVSLVGNQALFASRAAIADREWADALGHARKARVLLPWSHEALVAYGDASAGLGDRRATITAYQRALRRDPDNWIVWLRLAQVTRGKQSVHAYERVHRLNPLQPNLPEYVYR